MRCINVRDLETWTATIGQRIGHKSRLRSTLYKIVNEQVPDTSNYLSFPVKLFIASFTSSLLKWSNPDRESCNILQLPSWRQWNSILRINGLKPDYSVHLLFLTFFNMIERQTINNLNFWLATWWNVSIEKRSLTQKK